MANRVRLHFRSLGLTTVPWQTHFDNAVRVYAQYGITIELGSGVCLALTAGQASRYAIVNGSCDWRITSGEYFEVQRLGGPIPKNEIGVFYVNRFQSATSLGCGGHAPGRYACIVASGGSQWTTAHEVGHVLLGSGFSPVHSSSTTNLMYSSTPSITGNPPALTAAQVTQMKASPCCV